MIEVILGMFGVALLFYSPIPLSGTREIVKPRTTYLGVAILLLIVFSNIIKLPDFIRAWVPMFIPVIAIFGALFLSQAKSTPVTNATHEKSKFEHIINVITWVLLLGILAVVVFMVR